MRAHAVPVIASVEIRRIGRRPEKVVQAQRARPCDGVLGPRDVRGGAFACPTESHRPPRPTLRTIRAARLLPVIRQSLRAQVVSLLQPMPPIRAHPRQKILRLLRRGARRQRGFRARDARPARSASTAVESRSQGASALLRLSFASQGGEIAALQSCTTSPLRPCARLSLRSRRAPTQPLRHVCAGKARSVLPARRGCSSPCGCAPGSAANQPCRSIVAAA